MIKYPKKNDNLKIAISSISDGTNEKMNVVMDYLKKNNIPFESTPFVFDSKNQVCNDPKTRAESFMKMWNDDNFNYIISSFGGEFCMEILPYILLHASDFKINKKWFQGFSDASYLTYYLTTNYNLATINHYNAEDYGSVRNLTKLKDTLCKIKELERGYSFMELSSKEYVDGYSRDVNDNTLNTKITCPKCAVDTLSFSGVLIGGWIEAISMICGTKFDNTRNFCKQFDEGIIWYIDNCELSSPMLRRRLWQMQQAGYFDNCNGVLLGREPRDEFIGNYNYHQAISDTFDSLNIPVIEEVDIGHFFPQWLIINGSYAEVNYEKGKMKILQRLK